MMFIPLNPTKKQFQMTQDACFIAGQVVSDLGIAFMKPGAFWNLYLSDKFGPFEYADLRNHQARGYYDLSKDEIKISCFLPLADAGEVLRHEICHRLCLGTERYSHLNLPRFAEYDWLTFQEMIAEIVHLAYTNQSLYETLMTLAELELN